MTTVRHGIRADALKANVRKDLMSDALSCSNPGLCLSLHLLNGLSPRRSGARRKRSNRPSATRSMFNAPSTRLKRYCDHWLISKEQDDVPGAFAGFRALVVVVDEPSIRFALNRYALTNAPLKSRGRAPHDLLYRTAYFCTFLWYKHGIARK